jgi:DNA-binding NarL/FixJ family response regulator
MTRPPFAAMGTTQDTSSRTARVVIAEESMLFREGIARCWRSQFRGRRSGGGRRIPVAQGRQSQPDIATIDVRMPPTHADERLRAAHLIRAEHIG